MIGSMADQRRAFRPNIAITRAEVAATIVRALNLTRPVNTSPPQTFTDISQNHWAADYITIASENDIIFGFAERFRPDDPVTREEFSAIIVRAKAEPAVGEVSFGDNDKISSWAQAYVFAAYDRDWMQGDAQNNFLPRSALLRSESTAVVVRILGWDTITSDSLVNVQEDLIRFSDNLESRAWYYYYIIAATNTRHYVIENNVEIWIRVIR